FEYKNLLYDYFFINTCLKVSKGIYLIGIFVQNADEETSTDIEAINKIKNETNEETAFNKNVLISCYVIDFNRLKSFTYQHSLKSFNDKDFDFNKDENSYNQDEEVNLEDIGKIAFNFVFNICDMLNNKQVDIIEKIVSEKKINKRLKRNMPPGSEIIIELEPNQELKRYISKFNSESTNKLSHKFLVRGHYFYLRNKQHYTKTYKKLEDDSLPENMFYDENSQLIKCWKKPCYKGEGIAVVKDVKLK
nr:hypothetical protein [Candidatus Woesearchaeota archaeon]